MAVAVLELVPFCFHTWPFSPGVTLFRSPAARIDRKGSNLSRGWRGGEQEQEEAGGRLPSPQRAFLRDRVLPFDRHGRWTGVRESRQERAHAVRVY